MLTDLAVQPWGLGFEVHVAAPVRASGTLLVELGAVSVWMHSMEGLW